MSINYGTDEDYSEYMKDPRVPDTPLGEIHGDTENAPGDKWNLVFWIMFLQGTGVLFAWNSFISAPDYFVKSSIFTIRSRCTRILEFYQLFQFFIVIQIWSDCCL
jgi:hypothetical protein